MKWYLSVFRHYAVFEGRARRKEYWYFVLFDYIILLALSWLGAALDFYIPYFVYLLASLIPSIAVAVRRMHDTGNSGWCCLIPIYNLVLAFTKGDTGENRYGPDPKGEQYSFDFENEPPAE